MCRKQVPILMEQTDIHRQVYSDILEITDVKKNSREKNYFSSHWYLPIEASIHWQV